MPLAAASAYLRRAPPPPPPPRRLSSLDVANLTLGTLAFLQIFLLPRQWRLGGGGAAVASAEATSFMRHYDNFGQHFANSQLALVALMLFIAKRGDAALRKDAAGVTGISQFCALFLALRQQEETALPFIVANIVALGGMACCNIAAFLSNDD